MRTSHKILYKEEKPIKREITFENREKYLEFWNPYFKDILETAWDKQINYKEIYNYRIYNLNMDGSISKPHDAQALLTPEAKAKQKKNWGLYLEKQKKMSIEAGFKRKLFEIESKIEYWQKQKQELIKEHDTS